MVTRRGVLGVTFALAAFAAGCGGSATDPTVGPSDGGGPPPTFGPRPPGVANGALPSIVVNDVAAGTRVDLSTVPPADKPLLVWFWAPH